MNFSHLKVPTKYLVIPYHITMPTGVQNVKVSHFPFTPIQNYKNVMQTSIKVIYSDLVEGWATAVLNNEEELKFIREGQKTNRITGRYWIGGSTNASEDSTIGYSDYYTSGSGNHIV